MYLSLKRVLNQVFNGLFWGFLMRVMNRVRIHNHKILLDAVFERDGTRPLITVQNHQSMIDDPALWTAVLPWWRLPPTMFRWGICTEDMFFAHPVLTYIMQHGNVLPIDRTGSLDQPSFEQLFLKLKRQKAWVHLFPEGKVNQSWRYLDGEPMLGVFKPGVGKLIAHLGTDSYPIILPIIHKNMDAVLPEIALKPGTKKRSKPISMVPKAGKKVEFYVGEPFDLKKEVEQFKQEHPEIHFDSFTTPNTDSLKFYQRLTDIVAQKMLQLEAEVREKCA
jgi:monolysocardiolipin acyltransferase